MRAVAVRTWAVVRAVRARVMAGEVAVRARAAEVGAEAPVAVGAADAAVAVGDELPARVAQSTRLRVRTNARLRAARGIGSDRLRVLRLRRYAFERSFGEAASAMRDQGAALSVEDRSSGTIIGSFVAGSVTANVSSRRARACACSSLTDIGPEELPSYSQEVVVENGNDPWNRIQAKRRKRRVGAIAISYLVRLLENGKQ